MYGIPLSVTNIRRATGQVSAAASQQAVLGPVDSVSPEAVDVLYVLVSKHQSAYASRSRISVELMRARHCSAVPLRYQTHIIISYITTKTGSVICGNGLLIKAAAMKTHTDVIRNIGYCVSVETRDWTTGKIITSCALQRCKELSLSKDPIAGHTDNHEIGPEAE